MNIVTWIGIGIPFLFAAGYMLGYYQGGMYAVKQFEKLRPGKK
jgi:hypothetical protein